MATHRKLFMPPKLDPNLHQQAFWVGRFGTCFKNCFEFIYHDDDDDDKGKESPSFDGPPFPPRPRSRPPPPNPQLQSNQEPHFPNFLIALCSAFGAVILLICYLVISKRRHSNLNNPSRENQQPLDDTREEFIDEDHGPVLDNPIWYINTIGLQQSVIDSIAVFKYKKGEGLIEGTECSVCLSEFEDDENLRLLPKCSHAFHLPCIDTWLRSHTNCPLCRAPIACNGHSDAVISTTAEPNSNHLISREGENSGDFPGNGRSHVGEDRTSEVRIEEDNNISSVPATEEGHINNKRYMFLYAANNETRVHGDSGEEVQPKRRSVSMDSSLACSNTKPLHAKKLKSAIIPYECSSRRNSSTYRMIKSSSFRVSLQRGNVSMKRSFSSSGLFVPMASSVEVVGNI